MSGKPPASRGPREPSVPPATPKLDAAAFLVATRAIAGRSHAQILQDLWVLWQLDFPKSGFVLDIGAGDGVRFSNSLLFEELGWSGLLVEPNPRHAEALAARRMKHVAACIWTASDEQVGFLDVVDDPDFSRLAEGLAPDMHDRSGRRDGAARVEAPTLDAETLMRRYGCPDLIDYLSLDIEGAEAIFLQGLDLTRWRFRCITVEHNYTPERDVIAALLGQHGYVRVFEALSQWDDWYVASDLLAGRSAPDATGVSWLEPRSDGAQDAEQDPEIAQELFALRTLLGFDPLHAAEAQRSLALLLGAGLVRRALALAQRATARWPGQAQFASLERVARQRLAEAEAAQSRPISDAGPAKDSNA